MNLEFELYEKILRGRFDTSTGGLAAMNIVGSDGKSIKDKWDHEVATYMGMTCNSFPNMYAPRLMFVSSR